MIRGIQLFFDRTAAKLNVLNTHLEARLRKNRQILDEMHKEEDFKKLMGYLESLFQ